MKLEIKKIYAKIVMYMSSVIVFLFLASSFIFDTVENITGIHIEPQKIKEQVADYADDYLQTEFGTTLQDLGINVKDEERANYDDPDIDAEDLGDY